MVGSPGNRWIVVRDPYNLAHVTDPGSRQLLQQAGFTNRPVYSEQEFLAQFTQGGSWAIFTGP